MSTETISIDEYKVMHTLCSRFYHQNMSEERKRIMREKQRVRNRERYQNEPEYRERIKSYMNARNASKRAAVLAALVSAPESGV
jgi:hypothetical protein